MPSMGRPVTAKERAFSQVTMAPKDLTNRKEPTGKEKERLLNKITGYAPKNDLYANSKTHNKMGKDEFLKLLTYQLQNQDPMKPMEQGKMAAELAQFSQLEQLSNLNTKFDDLNANAKVEDKFYGASFLGKEVVTSGRTLDFKGEGSDADILFTLPKPASRALIRIFDSKNNMVGEIWKENLGRGNNNVQWDGKQLDGAFSGAGEFKVNVLAWDDNADPMQVETKVKGQVESVFFENEEAVLLVDGKKVFLRDVDSFHVPGQTQNVDVQGSNAPATASAFNQARQQAMQQARQQAAQQMSGANTAPTNLPIADSVKNRVKLNNQAPVKAYQANNAEVGTGLTNVYDVE